MRETPESYMEQVRALCARPSFSDPQARVQFLFALQAYWTRQINAHSKGQPTIFAPSEIHDLLDSLSLLIKEHQLDL